MSIVDNHDLKSRVACPVDCIQPGSCKYRLTTRHIHCRYLSYKPWIISSGPTTEVVALLKSDKISITDARYALKARVDAVVEHFDVPTLHVPVHFLDSRIDIVYWHIGEQHPARPALQSESWQTTLHSNDVNNLNHCCAHL